MTRPEFHPDIRIDSGVEPGRTSPLIIAEGERLAPAELPASVRAGHRRHVPGETVADLVQRDARLGARQSRGVHQDGGASLGGRERLVQRGIRPPPRRPRQRRAQRGEGRPRRHDTRVPGCRGLGLPRDDDVGSSGGVGGVKSVRFYRAGRSEARRAAGGVSRGARRRRAGRLLVLADAPGERRGYRDHGLHELWRDGPPRRRRRRRGRRGRRRIVARIVEDGAAGPRAAPQKPQRPGFALDARRPLVEPLVLKRDEQLPRGPFSVRADPPTGARAGANGRTILGLNRRLGEDEGSFADGRDRLDAELEPPSLPSPSPRCVGIFVNDAGAVAEGREERVDGPGIFIRAWFFLILPPHGSLHSRHEPPRRLAKVSDAVRAEKRRVRPRYPRRRAPAGIRTRDRLERVGQRRHPPSPAHAVKRE
mmetsp:Transcript_7852/g.31082  ORF Transcript_7852/g.31082 Transcript_7852/m.31082 type:complete len:422 (+) Transcript_7852:2656-3921(+)